jgi:hypothetical protein
MFIVKLFTEFCHFRTNLRQGFISRSYLNLQGGCRLGVGSAASQPTNDHPEGPGK